MILIINVYCAFTVTGFGKIHNKNVTTEEQIILNHANMIYRLQRKYVDWNCLLELLLVI